MANKKRYTYKTQTDKAGNKMRYRCWNEVFKCEDTGKPFPILRHKLIKINGEKVVWYSNYELRQMSSEQRKSIQIKLKTLPSRRRMAA